jgi:hypothetical protein
MVVRHLGSWGLMYRDRIDIEVDQWEASMWGSTREKASYGVGESNFCKRPDEGF